MSVYILCNVLVYQTCNNLLVSVGHLCDLPVGFAGSDNLVTLYYTMKKDLTELQLMLM